MNLKARDLVISNGRRIIKQIQKLMGRCSLIGDREFLGSRIFRGVVRLRRIGGRSAPSWTKSCSIASSYLTFRISRPIKKTSRPTTSGKLSSFSLTVCDQFDDTFPHEVWNDTDSIRVVLFMDILRPLPAPVALLNNLIIKIIAASPFIRDAKRTMANGKSAWLRCGID